MISNRGMAKATRSKRRKRNVPISLSSTDTYTAAEYLTSVLGSRTIAYIIALPPSFLFIVCLLLISMFLPFLGLYVHNAGHVPDLDAMMWWKSLTGKLRKEPLCLHHAPSNITRLPEFPKLCNNKTLTLLSAGVEIKFSNIEVLASNEVWYASLSGSSLKVAVNSKDDGSSLQDCVTIHLTVQNPNVSCHQKVCSGCLHISVPMEANHVDHIQTGNQPYYSCPALNTSASTVYRELHLKNKNDCSTSIVGHVKEEYRQHGVVLVYLNKDEQATSAHRLYACAGLALLAAVIFGILSSLTDKPRDSRLGNE